MITREEFIKALDIVEAYYKQITENKSIGLPKEDRLTATHVIPRKDIKSVNGLRKGQVIFCKGEAYPIKPSRQRRGWDGERVFAVLDESGHRMVLPYDGFTANSPSYWFDFICN